MLRANGSTDKGRVRPINEDCFAIDHLVGLCVVADGMGGHKAGEVAARIAVDAVVDYVRQTVRDGWPFGFNPELSENGNLLRTAIHIADLQILESSLTVHDHAGMGTTLVVALLAGNRLTVAHVGDSRLYLLNESGLRQLTTDDSWAASMLAQDPHADVASLRHHPLHHALTNVVGTRPRTEVHVAEQTLNGGELIVLTTDGVHGSLDERQMEWTLTQLADPGDMANALVARAIARDSRDNCTAVVGQYVAD